MTDDDNEFLAAFEEGRRLKNAAKERDKAAERERQERLKSFHNGVIQWVESDVAPAIERAKTQLAAAGVTILSKVTDRFPAQPAAINITIEYGKTAKSFSFMQNPGSDAINLVDEKTRSLGTVKTLGKEQITAEIKKVLLDIGFKGD